MKKHRGPRHERGQYEGDSPLVMGIALVLIVFFIVSLFVLAQSQSVY